MTDVFSLELRHDEPKLCHCALSDDIYVVTDKTCCEVCTYERQPITPENVALALKWYATERERLHKQVIDNTKEKA